MEFGEWYYYYYQLHEVLHKSIIKFFCAAGIVSRYGLLFDKAATDILAKAIDILQNEETG